MDPGSGFGACDPMGVFGSSGYFTVKRGSGFGDNKRQPGHCGFEKGFIKPAAKISQKTTINDESLIPEKSRSPTGYARIWVRIGDDHATDAGGQDRFRAGRGLAVVVAGFQGDIKGGALSLRSRLP